jgi:hypothetical protein
MKRVWQIVWGLIGVVAVDQILVHLSHKQLTSPAAVADYISRADWRVLSDEEVKANGGNPDYQSCSYKRSTFLYKGMICYVRIPYDDKKETGIFYWSPISLFDPFSGSVVGEFQGLDGEWIFSRDGTVLRETIE